MDYTFRSQPTMQSVINTVSDNIAKNIKCAQIARILAVDTANLRLTVLPLNKIFDGTEYVEHPQLINVPYIILSGGGSSVLLPVNVDDLCLLIFCDNSIDNTLLSDEASDPANNNMHSINDGIAIVGLFSQLSLPDYSANMQLIDAVKITLTTPLVDCSEWLQGNLKANNGASGSFTSQDGKSITVANGIVTSIS